METLTRERNDAKTACKGVKADLASRVETRLEVYAACNVALANVIQELEAVAELHRGVAKEVWDKDDRATTETMHQDDDNDNVEPKQAQMEIS